MAPFPLRLWEEKFREPDVLFLSREHLSSSKSKLWERADLVMEVPFWGKAWCENLERYSDFSTSRTACRAEGPTSGTAR